MNLQNIIKRILHPGDWMIEKDIHDLEIEIELAERQLPALRRKLNELRTRKQKYQD